MHLHNTLTGGKEEFQPLDPTRVTMYVCGPTVYSFAHIGNARPAVVFDVLARVLRRKYGQDAVVYARNITDIDDKINAAAQKEGVAIDVIATRYAKVYHDDMAALGVARPDFEPRVTENLPAIIAMIERLVAAGHAYAAEGEVLFHVPSYPDYGKLSKRDTRELLAGARVDVAKNKKYEGDFVLWKPSTPDQPGWDSPWGRGRPGWHIECSAMSEKVLGETLDIHGGGMDLVFPHHENERAQSTCAHGGKPFARYWLHNGFLTVNSEKMAKSVGNVLLVHDLVQQHPGEAIRLALLNGHYRQPLDWTDETVPNARRQLDRLYGALRELDGVTAEPGHGASANFVAALEDDLNTPMALADLFELARQANVASAHDKPRIKAQFQASAALLGLLQQAPEAWFKQVVGTGVLQAGSASMSGTGTVTWSEEAIEQRIAARKAARAAKDFKEADRIRDELAQGGVVLEDVPGGTRWKRSA